MNASPSADNVLPGRYQPFPSSSSKALWTVLGREMSQSQSGTNSSTAAPSTKSITIPQLTPVDKTGASMRIMLYDTQLSLEKFSGRVDKLTTGVEDARREVVTVQRMFEGDRDKVVGSPAQAADLELIAKSQTSIEAILRSLDRRIDALQTLTQTQAHALHTMQEQQNAMLTAVLPLLPLVQAIPLHVDQVRTNVAETVNACLLKAQPSGAGSTTDSHVEQIASRIINAVNANIAPIMATSDIMKDALQTSASMIPVALGQMQQNLVAAVKESISGFSNTLDTVQVTITDSIKTNSAEIIRFFPRNDVALDLAEKNAASAVKHISGLSNTLDMMQVAIIGAINNNSAEIIECYPRNDVALEQTERNLASAVKEGISGLSNILDAMQVAITDAIRTKSADIIKLYSQNDVAPISVDNHQYTPRKRAGSVAHSDSNAYSILDADSVSSSGTHGIRDTVSRKKGAKRMRLDSPPLSPPPLSGTVRNDQTQSLGQVALESLLANSSFHCAHAKPASSHVPEVRQTQNPRHKSPPSSRNNIVLSTPASEGTSGSGATRQTRSSPQVRRRVRFKTHAIIAPALTPMRAKLRPRLAKNQIVTNHQADHQATSESASEKTSISSSSLLAKDQSAEPEVSFSHPTPSPLSSITSLSPDRGSLMGPCVPSRGDIRPDITSTSSLRENSTPSVGNKGKHREVQWEFPLARGTSDSFPLSNISHETLETPRPMSLRDRQANLPFFQRSHGKRFIPLRSFSSSDEHEDP